MNSLKRSLDAGHDGPEPDYDESGNWERTFQFVRLMIYLGILVIGLILIIISFIKSEIDISQEKANVEQDKQSQAKKEKKFGWIEIKPEIFSKSISVIKPYNLAETGSVTGRLTQISGRAHPETITIKEDILNSSLTKTNDRGRKNVRMPKQN